MSNREPPDRTDSPEPIANFSVDEVASPSHVIMVTPVQSDDASDLQFDVYILGGKREKDAQSEPIHVLPAAPSSLEDIKKIGLSVGLEHRGKFSAHEVSSILHAITSRKVPSETTALSNVFGGGLTANVYEGSGGKKGI